jgi:spermidine/putrescine ABC transporter ATP-binding subunit
MNSATTAITLDGLTKRFGALTAVAEVSLELREGEFFALLGPSGCGKTTLLRMIAGFEVPDEGRILLDGTDITALRASRRPVNLMFQSYALFPHMTVAGNIAYGLEMEKRPKAEIAKRVEEVMAMAELTGLAGRKPDQLSGGQRQRVALARALVKRPRVLLLDEPLAALDKKLRAQMQLELKRLQHEVGITFVVVTHDQEEALVMADRVALMRAGRVEQLGEPQALYENPASRFVADFIGVTNFFEGELVAGGLSISAHGVLAADVPNGTQPGREASLAVRPERMGLSPRDGAVRESDGSNNALPGVIREIAYHGQDLNFHVAVEALPQNIMVRLSAADAMAGSFSVGQAVWCSWRSEHGRILTQ